MNLEELAENLLWDKVSGYAESVEEFKKMVKDICYINREKVDQVVWCEIFDSDEFCVVGTEEKDDKICVEFEMPFIMSCWDKDDNQLFRVTAYAEGVCEIPGEEQFDYSEIDFSDMSEIDDLEVEIVNIIYEDVEVDSVY